MPLTFPQAATLLHLYLFYKLFCWKGMGCTSGSPVWASDNQNYDLVLEVFSLLLYMFSLVLKRHHGNVMQSGIWWHQWEMYCLWITIRKWNQERNAHIQSLCWQVSSRLVCLWNDAFVILSNPNMFVRSLLAILLMSLRLLLFPVTLYIMRTQPWTAATVRWQGSEDVISVISVWL